MCVTCLSASLHALFASSSSLSLHLFANCLCVSSSRASTPTHHSSLQSTRGSGPLLLLLLLLLSVHEQGPQCYETKLEGRHNVRKSKQSVTLRQTEPRLTFPRVPERQLQSSRHRHRKHRPEETRSSQERIRLPSHRPGVSVCSCCSCCILFIPGTFLYKRTIEKIWSSISVFINIILKRTIIISLE